MGSSLGLTEATWERLVGSRGMEIADIVSHTEGDLIHYESSRGLLIGIYGAK